MKRITFIKWPAGERRGEKVINQGALVLGVMWAVSITLAVITAIGVYVMISMAQGFHMAGVLKLVTYAGVGIGAMVCGGMSARQGLVHGLLVGGIYALCYLLLTTHWGIYGLETELLINVLMLLLAGAAGGIVGVNLPGGRIKRRGVRRMR
ncbi:MAG: TIGR04086 family membrane protein [Desulfotomaculum sp.]|nr:TIGR04086 family membrane protein [Desulfotomaculum sp.]